MLPLSLKWSQKMLPCAAVNGFSQLEARETRFSPQRTHRQMTKSAEIAMHRRAIYLSAAA
jgi:hypothetical protein